MSEVYCYFVAYCETSHTWGVYNILKKLRDEIKTKTYDSFDDAVAEAELLNKNNSRSSEGKCMAGISNARKPNEPL